MVKAGKKPRKPKLYMVDGPANIVVEQLLPEPLAVLARFVNNLETQSNCNQTDEQANGPQCDES